MKPSDRVTAQVIANNLRELLGELRGGFKDDGSRCCTCGQILRSPFTQEWVAEQCGMTKATIVHYFQGTRIPSVLSLKKIADVFDVEIDVLLKGI